MLGDDKEHCRSTIPCVSWQWLRVGRSVVNPCQWLGTCRRPEHPAATERSAAAAA